MKPLLEWMRENLDDEKDPFKNLVYGDGAVKQMIYFRDNIAPLFFPQELCHSGYDDAGKKAHQLREQFAKIASWHTSKSCKLPVYYVEHPLCKVYARDNFYNWNITIISKVDIGIPEYMNVTGSDDYLYFEGMDNEMQRPSYKQNQKEFSFAAWNQNKFFAIMWLIAAQVKGEKTSNI